MKMRGGPASFASFQSNQRLAVRCERKSPVESIQGIWARLSPMTLITRTHTAMGDLPMTFTTGYHTGEKG